MAKRELSSTLKSLKFMQRAVQKEEQTKKVEDVIVPDGNFVSSTTVIKKCVVIMAGDPHPGALRGRLSFRSFNPSIDKLNGEAATEPEDSFQSGMTSSRENGSSRDGSKSMNEDGPNSDANADLKRKQPEDVTETPHRNKSPKNALQSSPHGSRSGFKKPNRDKLDWNVLRPQKSQSKRGLLAKSN